ncbi:MAG: asparagine synthase (glutamine-hydrolyzing) [Clostridiales bacterium]|jgi:asparagine synthase (glutamine-hydrolysing)|nr:asparagine synthase (glutamine-hydrolyzing) [Clostridiales bacterium]
MCGFVGFTGRVKNAKRIVLSMANLIAHRGPDSEGVYLGDDITLGFRRLSIIGLDDGAQPMYNEDNSLVVVFNGEIYNYRELKDELVASGHSFHTHSDTETLLHLYEEYGVDMVDKLRGMFAFALYDIKERRLFCARDFFGIKPLYYGYVGKNLIFGSEIKAFLAHPDFKKELNTEAMENYLTFQYSALTETFFKGVYKLPPGHCFIYSDEGLTVRKYFEAVFRPQAIGFRDAVNMLSSVINESVERHKIVADVEVGSFLSSGVDSSYVASSFGGGKTFTVGFDYDNYNEISYAKELSDSLGITNYDKTITTEEYWDVLPDIQYHMDEPLADPSAVALYFVSQTASKYVKVALSGEGADEFFGGYNIYREPLDIRPLTNLPMPLRRLMGKIASVIPFNVKGKNLLIRAGQSIEERFIGNAKIFSKRERDEILRHPRVRYEPKDITGRIYDICNKAANGREQDDITKMQTLDVHMWMVGDILLKADKMSMAHSLEVRVPYLDKEVFKVASVLPTHLRCTKQGTKLTFREVARQKLPKSVAEKKKLGFPVPIRIWLREDKYYELVKRYFAGKSAGKYFKTNKLLKLLDEHKRGKCDNSRKIWTVYMFLIWYERFFERDI